MELQKKLSVMVASLKTLSIVCFFISFCQYYSVIGKAQYKLCTVIGLIVSIIEECSTCLYKDNVLIKPFFKCNSSVCNCSFQLECSAAVSLEMNVSSSISIRWYLLDKRAQKLVPVQGCKIEERVFDDYIQSRLVLQNVQEKELFTHYWCQIDSNDNIDIAMSINAATHLHIDNDSTSCMFQMGSQLNETCTDLLQQQEQQDDHLSDGAKVAIPIIVICSVCTFLGVVLSLSVVLICWIVHGQKGL